MNKTAIVTGASKGIGYYTALSLSRAGYNVVINYNKSKLEAECLAKAIIAEGGNAITICADVANRQQVDDMVSECLSRFNRVDALINNAGIASQELFTDISIQMWQRMMDVNVNGCFNCAQAVLPHMISEKRGKIVNISSIWGMVGASMEVHYSTSKAAVIGFTKALAKEVGPSNIQVNCVAPGVIQTEMNDNLTKKDLEALVEETPLCRLGSAIEVASCIEFLVSEKSNFVTGQVISPNGGLVI